MLKVIDEIGEKNKYQAFLYIGGEDIKQEVAQVCINVADKLDTSKASPKTFFSRCATNHLKNLKRNLYYRFENPCIQTKCPMFNLFTGECTSTTYQAICPVYKKIDEKMQNQISVANAASLEEAEEFVIHPQNNEEIDGNIMKKEIRSIVVAVSGEICGVQYDVLTKYGQSYIPRRTLKFIRKVAREYLSNE